MWLPMYNCVQYVNASKPNNPDLPSKVLMAQRARWTSKYEKGLVEVLTEYNLSHYRGQNGWCLEGWNRIVKDINKLFPEASFTKSQIQDKEAQLKKDYKALKSIVKRSGISWNSTACIINTTAEKWDEIIEEALKLRRYENMSFPLFEALDLLYEGQLAQGKYCFTSSMSTQPSEERERTLNTSSDAGRKNKIQSSASRKHLRDERESTIDLPPKMTVTESQGIDNYAIEDEEQNSMLLVLWEHKRQLCILMIFYYLQISYCPLNLLGLRSLFQPYACQDTILWPSYMLTC